MNNPLVTIITPSFNQGEYIEDTILSILQQTYSTIEYIVVDGVSTDKTHEILKKYCDKISSVIIEPDEGQTDAINKGINISHGSIIGYVNSDDLLENDAVERVVSFFSNNVDVNMVYGSCHYIDDKGELLYDLIPGSYDLNRLILGNYISQPTVFFRTELIMKIGFFDKRLHYAMDYDYWLRIAMQGKIIFIPRFLAKFRIHSNSKTTLCPLDFYEETAHIMSKLLVDSKNLPYAEFIFHSYAINIFRLFHGLSRNKCDFDLNSSNYSLLCDLFMNDYMNEIKNIFKSLKLKHYSIAKNQFLKLETDLNHQIRIIENSGGTEFLSEGSPCFTSLFYSFCNDLLGKEILFSLCLEVLMFLAHPCIYLIKFNIGRLIRKFCQCPKIG